jgi:hypothetical protein
MGRADQTPYRAIHNTPQDAGGSAPVSATCKEEGFGMSTIQAAIYARVSSERQATAQTIASQLAALRERVTVDGDVVPEAMQCLDDG